MPDLFCTLPDNDFIGYAAIQEIIFICSPRLVNEKALPATIVIQISFFTAQDKLAFLQMVGLRLPALAWREKP